MPTIEDFVKNIETWQHQRQAVFDRRPYEDGASAESLREFVEIQTRLSRRMISILEKQDPEFFTALFELANHAQSLIQNAKTYVNGEDVTHATGGQ